MEKMSSVTFPDGSTYEIVDAEARRRIANGEGGGGGNSTNGKRNFILIGDSFGGGVVTSSETTKGWIAHCQDYFGNSANVFTSVNPLGGVYGFASSRPFLDVLIDTENNIEDKNSITDIVVLGGTNDIGQGSNIESAIATFMTYCKESFPNAHVKIGVLGTNVSSLYSSVYPEYQTCMKYGAEFIHDTVGLLCLSEYVSSDNVHLTADGYTFYNPYIAQAVLTGKCPFKFTRTTTITSNGRTTFETPIAIEIAMSEKVFTLSAKANDGTWSEHSGIIVANPGTGNIHLNIGSIESPINTPFDFARFNEGMGICTVTYANGSFPIRYFNMYLESTSIKQKAVQIALHPSPWTGNQTFVVTGMPSTHVY